MASGNFTDQAEDYARGRPGYAPSLVEALLASAGVRAGDAVVDLGAGTGLFTQALCGRGLRVTAVEPNPEMRRHALDLPEVTWLEGTFEATGLPTASQRWATAAQAFHWADPSRALPEVRRVLVPGGRFTLLWQHPLAEGNPILTWAGECLKRHVPELGPPPSTDWEALLLSTGHFADPVRHEGTHVVLSSPESYLAGIRSGNHLAEVAGPERLAAYVAEVGAYLRAEGIESFPVTWRGHSLTVTAV